MPKMLDIGALGVSRLAWTVKPLIAKTYSHILFV